ncbi:hypothetical protein D9M71_728920 [compost metagenome]
MRPRQKLRTDVLALGGDHRRLTIKHVSALPTGNFCCSPWGWQAARHLRAQRYYTTFIEPLLKLIERPAGPAVITHAVAQQAAADQNLLHFRTARCRDVGTSRSMTGGRGLPARLRGALRRRETPPGNRR